MQTCLVGLRMVIWLVLCVEWIIRIQNGRKCTFVEHQRFIPSNHAWRENKTSFDGKQELMPPRKRLSRADAL